MISPLFRFVLMTVLLLGAYAGTASLFSVPTWVGALFVHIVFVAGIFLFKESHKVALVPFGGDLKITFWVLGPGTLALGGTLLFIAASRLLVEAPPTIDGHSALASLNVWYLTVIPVVEEIVFRGWVTPYLARGTPTRWAGPYLSALLFAILHASSLRFDNLTFGIAAGPFVLALVCEIVVHRSGTLAGAMFLHAACNLNIWIFSVLDHRWLKWVPWLYVG